MNSRNTLLLFLALLLVYSTRAVSAIWVPSGAQKAETALVHFEELPEGVSISVDIPAFTTIARTINGKQCIIPSIEGAYPALKSGYPDLPVITSLLRLSATTSVSLELISSSYQDHPDMDIAPSDGALVKAPGSTEPFFADVYKQNQFYPEIPVDQSAPFISRNGRYLAVHINPIQYNPVTRVMRVYTSMKFKVSFQEGSGINPLSAADIRISPMAGFNMPVLNRMGVADEKSSTTVNAKRMLVVCPEEYEQAIQPLLDWKLKCGIVTELVDPSQFTDAEQLKTYIKGVYYNQADLLYVLLVGDDDKVPTFTLPYGSSDNTFAYVAGNDHYPDLLVGRFSVSSVTELKAMVKKTLEYEINPATTNNWLSNATGIASTMSPGDDGESDFQHVRNLLGDLLNFTYTGKNEFFDGSQGDGDKDDDPATADVMKAFDNGTGLIIYAGHGSTSTWATGKITRSAIGTINNPGMYPLIISAACETGNFAGSCLAESWMRVGADQERPLGAVACLMASGTQTSYPPMEGQDEMIHQLTSLGNNGNSGSFGSIAVAGMGKMNSVYGAAGSAITDTWILFGDPSIQPRTQLPEVLTVQHAPAIGYHRTSFMVETGAIAGTATLTRNGILLGTAGLEAGITHILLDQPLEADSVLLTITAFNCYPYSIMIPVTKFPGQVSQQSPRNHSERNPIATQFSWESESGGLPGHYLFYLGTDNPPTNLLSAVRVADNHFETDVPLQYNQTYYWRVDAVNTEGMATGQTLVFNTIYGPDEDFEQWQGKNTDWTSAGNTSWILEKENVFNGLQSIRSGMVQQGDSSILVYSAQVEGCDFVGYWRRTQISSDEARLVFRMDGKVAESISNSHDWTYVSFGVDPGYHTFEWIYVNNSQTPALNDGAWLDDISLPVHHAMHTSLQAGTVVCEGQWFMPQAWAENFNSIEWQTEGDGIFEDAALLETAYLPGKSDILTGSVKLRMITSGFNHCAEKVDEIIIYPVKAPVINLPADTVVVAGNSMVLDASGSGITDYLWLPDNNPSAVIHVDSVGSERGTKTLTLRVTNEQGCSNEKTLRVYFPDEHTQAPLNIYPNPCQRNFTLESESGATRLTGLKLFNQAGQEVWTETGDVEIINSRTFNLPELPQATYFLVTASNTGTQVLPLLIQK